MKSKIQNNSKQNIVQNKFRPLNEILKEKILYDYYCNKHNINYFKYCSSCKKDICYQCEKESHKGHQFINYENIIPDIYEVNTMQEILKEYKKNYLLFLNIIKDWKNEFDNMLNDYKLKVNNFIEFILNFNKEKINFNSIYKYRIIYSMLLNYDFKENKKNEKNISIIELMEKLSNNKEKENIKKDYKWILNKNKLKELIINLNNNTFINKIKKIIDIIINDNFLQEKNKVYADNKRILVKNLPIKNKIRKKSNSIDITPCFNGQIKNNSSSGKNNNTSASSIGINNQNRITTSIGNSNNNQYKNNTGFINYDYTFCNNNYKTNYSKSTSNVKPNNKMNNNYKFCVYEKKKVRQKSNDYINNIKKIRLSLNNDNVNNNLKMNENILQNSINDTKIYFVQKRKKRPEKNVKRNIISSKTQNIINKTFLYNYKGFNIYDKDSGPELFNDTSSTIQGIKYVNSLENINISKIHGNTIDIGKKYLNTTTNVNSNTQKNCHSIDNKNINNTFRIERNNTCNIKTYNNYIYNNSSLYRLSRNSTKNSNHTLVNFYKPKNNSVENINLNRNNRPIISNSFAGNRNNNINNDGNKCNLIYINKKKDNSIYAHKKFINFDISKSLSSIDSITSSIISSNSNKENINENNNILNEINNINNKNMFKTQTYNINKSKENKLFLGLELGNTECKIGLIKQSKNFNNNNFELNNLNLINNDSIYTIPTIISFIPNNKINSLFEIKIGEEAEKYQFSNPSQTIFNIIKLFGKNTNEIVGRKDIWPFNIYNDTKTNKPITKLKCSNNKDEKSNRYIFFDFEEVLTIYLKKVFEIFFNKLKIEQIVNKENYNIYTHKSIDINIDITISVPNNFNYIQRKLIMKIFNNELFPNKEINKNNINMKSNIYGKYNIKLNNIKIENVSNLASYCIIEKNININKDIQNSNKNNLVIYIEGGSVNISIINLSKINNNYIIEIKGINGADFGEEDFLDNFIYDCLSDFKDKIRNTCLNSPVALIKLRKSLNIVKNCFDKNEIVQTEVNIDKLFGNLDLKLSVNESNYQKSCMGLFRKIIYLLKDTIIKSKIDIKDINDIILLGNITKNYKLKKLISELFKDNNKVIYNKLINKNSQDNNNNNNDYIIKGAIIQTLNLNITNNKYRIINISPSSFGVQSINGLMEIVIEKGNIIPIKYNKFIKIRRPDKNENNMITINIYEGESKYVKNNKLISKKLIDIDFFKHEKKDENSIEILFQFYIDINYNLNVFILDKSTFKRKFECLININYDNNKNNNKILK